MRFVNNLHLQYSDFSSSVLIVYTIEKIIKKWSACGDKKPPRYIRTQPRVLAVCALFASCLFVHPRSYHILVLATPSLAINTSLVCMCEYCIHVKHLPPIKINFLCFNFKISIKLFHEVYERMKSIKFRFRTVNYSGLTHISQFTIKYFYWMVNCSLLQVTESQACIIWLLRLLSLCVKLSWPCGCIQYYLNHDRGVFERI